jgi:hypothetical protein
VQLAFVRLRVGIQNPGTNPDKGCARAHNEAVAAVRDVLPCLSSLMWASPLWAVDRRHASTTNSMVGSIEFTMNDPLGYFHRAYITWLLVVLVQLPAQVFG